MAHEQLQLVAISVGNTRTAYGLFDGEEPHTSGVSPNEPLDALVNEVVALVEKMKDAESSAIVLASVNRPVADRLADEVGAKTARTVHRIGADVPIPLQHSLGDDHTTGQDRFLVAMAAHRMFGQACAVVDAGTAITVDFIDGEGAYHGGAILAGARMSMHALHEHTAQLPDVALRAPHDDEPFARTTEEAIVQGAVFGARGAVHYLLERYAEAYSAYPRVIATGGDAQALFADDEIVERIVPDLALRGIAIATVAALHGATTVDDMT
jgi:type III pantothenate kinase